MACEPTYGAGTEREFKPVSEYKHTGSGYGTEGMFGGGNEIAIHKDRMYSFCFDAPIKINFCHDELRFRCTELLRTITVARLNGSPINRSEELLYDFLKKY